MTSADESYQDYLESIAWKIYCEETKGSMHVADFWHELPLNVKNIYMNKAEDSLL